MPRVAILLGALLLAHAAWAQGVDYRLDTTVTFYGDNTEFFNPFREGRTTLGTYATLVGEARTSDRLAIRAGVFGNQPFGSSRGFDQVKPVLSLVIGGRASRLILGTLETVRRADGAGPDRTGPHGLLPPVQIETLAFERPWEAGMQWLVDTPRIRQDTWVHWQRMNTGTEREIFDAGLTSRLRLNHAATLRTDLFLVHSGGQLSASGVVSDSTAGTIGVDVGGPAGPFERVGLEALVLGSRFVPDRADRSDARSGFGTFLRASAEKAGWRAHAILWRGDDFIAREGDRQYQSLQLDGTEYRALRDYAEAGLTRLFPLEKRSWLEASLRWHRIENHYEYSFRILATAKLEIGAP
jgi:hypothetical protein